jgi:hypothetical protein
MRKLLVLAVLIVSTSAHALIIEPYTGILASGEYKSGTTELDVSGAIAGARLGFGLLPLLEIGVEAQGKAFKTESPDVPLNGLDTGIFVMYEAPVLLRIWYTHFVSAELNNGVANQFEGDGYKIGIGYTGLPLLSINLEMHSYSYDKLNGAATDTTVDATALSISLPLP